MSRNAGFSTRSIHTGQSPDPLTGDVIPPLHIASTFVMDEVGVPKGGYDYGRSGNPTRDTYQAVLASLESGAGALAFPAGLSSEDTLLRAVTQPGDHISFGADVYGGTFRLLDEVILSEGKTSTALNLEDLEAVEKDMTVNNSKILWVETPSNPLLQVFDIGALADLAHSHGALLVVDNTFASPYLQQPLNLGADVVVHSATKYIGGHSDLVGGALVVAENIQVPGNRKGWTGTGSVLSEVAYLQNAVGAIPSPYDAYLATRGLKTLAVRVQRQSDSAQEIAEFLEQDPRINTVNYPGLHSSPYHQLASQQMKGFGGVLSFEVGSPELAHRLCESTDVFSLAVSLGAVESLIEYPAAMTHGTKADSEWQISQSLVRISVGLEDSEDLIADLDKALG